jgi:hypothetical protein
MNLTDRDKQIIKEHIDRGEPLPPKYRLMLFADAPECRGYFSFGNDTTKAVEVKV